MTKLKDQQNTALNPNASHFNPGSKSQLRDYIVKCEKILYYAMDKISLKQKISTSVEFFFADISDKMICSEVYIACHSEPKRQACLLNSGD